MSALRISAAGRSTEPTVVVTQMRRRHLRAVLRIEERTSSTPWSLGLLLAEARRPERIYLVAREGSRIVGYAGLLFSLNDGHITTIAVDPDRQGAQIGSRLLLVLLREAIGRGATAITLAVRASNDAANALYRHFGFVPVGTRKGYYRNPQEDALVLWAHEVDTAAYGERLGGIEAGLDAPVVIERLATPRELTPVDPKSPEAVSPEVLSPEVVSSMLDRQVQDPRS
jgi:ribosomal-protein-alanine N-acetyltransferase